MNVLIVYAHPEPQSLTRQLVAVTRQTLERQGHDVVSSDLYGMRWKAVFDEHDFPARSDSQRLSFVAESGHSYSSGRQVSDIEAEQRKLAAADAVILQFPLWWFSLPGILKGWVDRVFAMGRFYGKDKLYEQGVFAGKKALLSLTTGGEAGAYEKGGFNGDMYNMLKPVHRGIFGFTGFRVLDPHVVYGPARMAPAQQTAALAQWSRRLQSIFEETPLEVGTY